MLQKIVLWILIVISPAALMAEDVHTYFMCKNKTGVRTMRIHREKADGNCLVTYTKSGQDSEVGRAKSLEFCTKVMNEIKDKLEGSGWACRDISKATLHDQMIETTP